MARPDERKNFLTLIRAYGEDEALRREANLVLIIGTRTGVANMGGHEQVVLENIVTPLLWSERVREKKRLCLGQALIRPANGTWW